ncbi:hypothetical protein PQ463_08215 [Flavobacterium sp. KACC 22763]|nr:hypothetical protein [Flavobacterium sp. KACC 22763]WDF66137.1 hypothetical protein PQ463_08215 [Flavobacterium sp. KACC 22763]
MNSYFTRRSLTRYFEAFLGYLFLFPAVLSVSAASAVHFYGIFQLGSFFCCKSTFLIELLPVLQGAWADIELSCHITDPSAVDALGGGQNLKA